MSKIVLNPEADLRLPTDDFNASGFNSATSNDNAGNGSTKAYFNPNQTMNQNEFSFHNTGNNSNSNFDSQNLMTQQQSLYKEVPAYDFLNNYANLNNNLDVNTQEFNRFDNFIFIIVIIFFAISLLLFVYFLLRYFNISIF